MIRLRPSGVDEILIKRVQDWYEPGPGVFIASTAGQTASFSPAQLFTGTTTGVWYDPSDLTTLYRDAAGTLPVTAVEQPVGRMLDKSGRGNHAFNPSGNSANFPVLSARYNLLTKTEQFDDAVWGKIAATVSANSTTSPAGTLTADTLIETAATSFHLAQIVTTPLTLTSGARYTYSIRAKAASGTRLLQLYPSFAAGGNSGGKFNLQTGVATAVAGTGSGTASMTALGDGWYECSFSFTSQGTGAADIYVGMAQSVSDGLYVSYAGDGTSGIYIWGADLRVANDALNQPAYQRVNTSTDYDTVGFKPYLRFNGTNQWLQTNSIDFTYGDKMFVSAGVRKLQESGASAQLICELSADAGTNNGGFYLTGWNGYQSPNHRYAMSSRGTASATSAETSASYAAPITNILSGIGNISGDQAILRVNGTQAAISTADQGTGNFGNYPLYMGARAGTSLWANIRFYGAVVAGKQASASEITNTETYLNQKTGAY